MNDHAAPDLSVHLHVAVGGQVFEELKQQFIQKMQGYV